LKNFIFPVYVSVETSPSISSAFGLGFFYLWGFGY